MGAFNGKSVKPLQLWHLPGFLRSSMFTIQKSEVSEVQMSLEACAPEAEQDCAARPLTLFARADGDAGPCPEEASDVAYEETAVQAQPSNGTLPDPIWGPRETGMAQAPSSSGSLIPAWTFSQYFSWTCSS